MGRRRISETPAGARHRGRSDENANGDPTRRRTPKRPTGVHVIDRDGYFHLHGTIRVKGRGIRVRESTGLGGLCSHLQVVAALLIGGWMVHTDQLEVSGVVAFISGAGRLNDPWGGLVDYFRDFSLTQVKYNLVADRVNQLSDRWTTVPTEQRTALRIEA